MGLVVKHTHEYPSGRIAYRRAFPPELRSIVLKREHKVSLGHPADAGFLTRYEAAHASYEVIVAKARRTLAGDFDELDAPTIAYLAEAFRVTALQNDKQARWSDEERGLHKAVRADLRERGIAFSDAWKGREGDRSAVKARAGLEARLPTYRDHRARGDLEGIVALWNEDAHDLVDAKGLVIDPSATWAMRRLCRALNDAAIAAGEACLGRLDGADVPTPPEPVRASPPRGDVAPASVLPMLPMLDAYAKAQDMTPGVRLDWRRMIEHLVGFVGHDDARRLTTDEVMRWRDHLLAETNESGHLRQPVTVKIKYLVAVKALLAWAVQEQKLLTNVAAVVVVKVPKKVKLREKDFTAQEVQAILRATLVPGSPRLGAGYRLARRWIPWLCAYTGARVNEFSQMRGEDVRKVDGVWTVRITPEAGAVKSKVARVVPIHEHLLEQGFLEAIKVRGQGPLFYDLGLQRVEKEGSRHFKKVGERLAEWVRKDVGITDPAVQPNHGWRHTFKTRAFAAGMQERIVDAIQRHAPATVSRSYGSVPVQTMADAIGKMPRFDIFE